MDRPHLLVLSFKECSEKKRLNNKLDSLQPSLRFIQADIKHELLCVRVFCILLDSTRRKISGTC